LQNRELFRKLFRGFIKQHIGEFILFLFFFILYTDIHSTMLQSESEVRDAIARAVQAAREAVAHNELRGGSCNYNDMDGGARAVQAAREAVAHNELRGGSCNYDDMDGSARAVQAAREAVAHNELRGGSCNYDDMDGGARDLALTKLGRPKKMNAKAPRNITRGQSNLKPGAKYSIATKVAARGALQDPKNRKYAIYFQEQAGGKFNALLAGTVTVQVKGKTVTVKRPRVVVGTPLSAAKKAVGILHKRYSGSIRAYTPSKGKSVGQHIVPQRRVSQDALVGRSSMEQPVHFKLVEITKGVRHTSKGKRVAVNGTANFVYEFYGWQDDVSGVSHKAAGKTIQVNHKNVAFRVANINSGKSYEALLAIYKKRASAARARALAARRR